MGPIIASFPKHWKKPAFQRVESPGQTRNSYDLRDSADSSGVVKATRVIIQPLFIGEMATEGGSNQSAVCTPKPFLKDGEPIKTGLFNVKRTPHGRYMTISSSEPVKLETSLIEPKTLHTSAGDLMTNNAVSKVTWFISASNFDHSLHCGVFFFGHSLWQYEWHTCKKNNLLTTLNLEIRSYLNIEFLILNLWRKQSLNFSC